MLVRELYEHHPRITDFYSTKPVDWSLPIDLYYQRTQWHDPQLVSNSCEVRVFLVFCVPSHALSISLIFHSQKVNKTEVESYLVSLISVTSFVLFLTYEIKF